jgi:hypothetical protein
MPDTPTSPNESIDFSERERRAALHAVARDARIRAQRCAELALTLQGEATRLRAASETLVAESKRLQADLQGAVTQYVRALRQLGERPERAIVLVKQMTDEAAVAVARDGAPTDRLQARSLREDVVRWTIDTYYGAP